MQDSFFMINSNQKCADGMIKGLFLSFIIKWESVWEGALTLEQTELAMKHTLFRVSVWDGEKIVAMARMNGDLGA